MLLTPQAVFGGTFDPIHCGHLAVAEYLFTHCPLAKIHFVPCLTPPHRPAPQASPEQRLDMVRLAIQDHPQWVANAIDLQRPGPSYMVDTLTLLQQSDPQIPWCLILGMDAFIAFNTWREWQKILTLAHLIVVNRPGFQLPQDNWLKTLLAEHQIDDSQKLTLSQSGCIFIAAMPPADISATAIRTQTLTNLSSALPPAVLKYIHQHNLYSHFE